jgi:Tfp pilus assembly protein PilO
VVLIFLLLRSQATTAAARQAELAALQAQHRAAQLQVEQLRDLRSKVAMATQNEQQFAGDNFLPRGAAFSEIMANLTDLAARSGLRPSDITFPMDQGDNQLGWVRVTANLAVEGEYPNLIRFLNELERSQLFWILQSLEVSSQGGQLRLNLQATTYLTPS